eukprot:scaffold282979_cov32-Tisochrysis_lutea.AAC.6
MPPFGSFPMATPLVPQLLLCALMGTMGAANILYEAVLGVALADKGGSVLHWLAEQVLGAGYAGVCVAVAYFLPLVVLVRAAIYVDRSLLCTEPLGFPRWVDACCALTRCARLARPEIFSSIFPHHAAQHRCNSASTKVEA